MPGPTVLVKQGISRVILQARPRLPLGERGARQRQRADRVIMESGRGGVLHTRPRVDVLKCLEFVDNDARWNVNVLLLNRHGQTLHELLLGGRAELEPFELAPSVWATSLKGFEDRVADAGGIDECRCRAGGLDDGRDRLSPWLLKPVDATHVAIGI